MAQGTRFHQRGTRTHPSHLLSYQDGQLGLLQKCLPTASQILETEALHSSPLAHVHLFSYDLGVSKHSEHPAPVVREEACSRASAWPPSRQEVVNSHRQLLTTEPASCPPLCLHWSPRMPCSCYGQWIAVRTRLFRMAPIKTFPQLLGQRANS